MLTTQSHGFTPGRNVNFVDVIRLIHSAGSGHKWTAYGHGWSLSALAFVSCQPWPAEAQAMDILHSNGPPVLDLVMNFKK